MFYLICMFRSSFVLFFVLFICVWTAFSSWFWYTNLSFFDWVSTGKTLSLDLTLNNWTTGFWVDILNPTEEPHSLKLDFVSQIKTSDGDTTCDMISWTIFRNYLLRNSGAFSVDPWQTERRRIDLNFPDCASWTYLACAIQVSPTEQSLWNFDLIAGKVNFMTLKVARNPFCIPFIVKTFPWSRSSSNFSNIGELRLYDESFALKYSWSVITNQNGTWILESFLPSWTYYVVYKWQSQLASYLTSIEIVEWYTQIFDFTTWTNLYNTQNKSITENDWYQYQIAWDLKNINGQYDFMVNGNDIAILTMSWFIDAGIFVLDPKNLNGDSAINVSDISVIGVNFELTDPYFSSDMFVW